MTKHNLKHYSNCCGAYLHDWPDNNLCSDCREFCGAYIESECLKRINTYDELVDACKTALQLIKDNWIEEHGNKQVGEAWGKLANILDKIERE